MLSVFLSYVSALTSIFRFPDNSPAQLRTAGRMLFIVAAILWAIGLSGIWGMARPLAIAATAGYFTSWANAVRHDAERRALVRVIAELSGHREPPTGPLRAVS